MGHDLGRQDRRPKLSQALGGEVARHDEFVHVSRYSPLPPGERGGVDERLGSASATVVNEAGRRVPAVAAGALRAVGEADPDSANEAVLVKVEDDAGARIARRRKRPPTECGVDVVGVEDSGAGAAHRFRHLLRCQPTAQQAVGCLEPAEAHRVVLEQLSLLAEVLADQPHEVAHRVLLSPGAAVAVVKKEDHADANVDSRAQ